MRLTERVHAALAEVLSPGDLAIDATAHDAAAAGSTAAAAAAAAGGDAAFRGVQRPAR